MNTTVVTSLYNIDRHELDGRRWESYLDWFSRTLYIKNPMVVFVEESLKPFVEKHRGSLDTHIIVSNLQDSRYYSHKEKIDSILRSNEYKKKIKSPERIECVSSLYNIIQYSKFDWVDRASRENPFQTENFLWLDAGISRFFDGIDIDSEFGIEKMPEDKLLLQIFMLSYPDLANCSFLDESYFWDDRSYVAGGIFLLNRQFAPKMNNLMYDTLSSILKNGMMSNEQITLGYLIKRDPDKFELFRHYNNIHRNYEILNILNSHV